MSIRIMSAVWDHSPQEGGTLLVLLALADWAKDDGCSWHSVKELAAKARLSERQVSRVLKILVESGELELPPGPRTHRSPYRIRQNVYKTPVSDHADVGGGSDESPASDPYVETVKNPKEPSRAVLVDQVWAHYMATFPRKRLKLGREHRKVIEDALSVRSVADCKRAITGLAGDSFYMGDNDRKTVYDEIHQALKGKRLESNEERIDKMAAKATPVEAAGGPRIDPARVARRLETVRANRSSDGGFEPRRAAIDQRELESWGYTIEFLDEAPWARLSIAEGALPAEDPSTGEKGQEAA